MALSRFEPALALILAAMSLLADAAGAAPLCARGPPPWPIAIPPGVAGRKDLPTLDFRYQAAPLKLADDGHTVRVRFGKGSELRVGGQRYALQQFHFHSPGGDRVAGEEFPMAAHLLHKSDAGQLLAVVVLFRQGADNPLLDRLLPLIPVRADGDHSPPGVTVDASALLPATRGYFRYTGSLTSAPCTEGVDWIVLKQPLTLSVAQLARYRQRFADNARAVQPLHGRVVLESR